MDKKFALILGLIVAAFVGLIIFLPSSTDAPSSNSIEPTNHKMGNVESSVVLTEYGDFQCPFCAQYFPLIQQLKTEYGDRIAIQFRHFPLAQIHQNAMSAHRAAEAAAEQGKFWEMHDLLYINQKDWSSAENVTSVFESYAKQLELDLDKFKADLADSATLARINADVKAGQDLEISGTPSFALNGKKIKTPSSYDEFVQIIEEALAAKESE